MSQLQWVAVRPSEAQRCSGGASSIELARENKALREALKAAQEQLNLYESVRQIQRRKVILKYRNYRRDNPTGFDRFKARMRQFIALFIVKEEME